MVSEIRRNGIITAGPNGGTLDLVGPHGEILAKFHVPPGRHRAAIYADLVEPGQELQIGEGAVYFRPRAGVTRITHPLALASDCNPDFQPTSASRLEREMRVELAQMKGLRQKIEARERAAAKAKEMLPPEPEKPVKPEPEPEAKVVE